MQKTLKTNLLGFALLSSLVLFCLVFTCAAICYLRKIFSLFLKFSAVNWGLNAKRALLSLPVLHPPSVTPGASPWQFRGWVWAEQPCLDGSHSGTVQVLLQALSLSSSPGGNKSCTAHLLLTLHLKELFKSQRKPYGNLYIRFICCSQFLTLHCILALSLKLSDNLVMAAHSFCALLVLQRRFLYAWSLQKWVQYPELIFILNGNGVYSFHIQVSLKISIITYVLQSCEENADFWYIGLNAEYWDVHWYRDWLFEIIGYNYLFCCLRVSSDWEQFNIFCIFHCQ